MTTLDQKAILDDVFHLSKKLGEISFPLAVQASSGFEVIPIDPKEHDDTELIQHIQNALNKFLQTSRKSQPVFTGKRINDLGKNIETQIVHELDRLPLHVRPLSRNGYPDVEILFKEKITYLEMKTSSITNRSDFRYFYYTNGNKIMSNARHLLLSIFATPAGKGRWKIKNMTLSDLSTLNVKLKAEFNASKKNLIDNTSRLFTVE